MKKWKPSEYHLVKNEWFIHEVNEKEFELLSFEPFKDANTYDQYGGRFYYYTVNLAHYTEKEKEKALQVFDETGEDEKVSYAFLAECLCEEKVVPYQEKWAETIKGLNDILNEWSIPLCALVDEKQGEIKRIIFQEK